MRRLLLPALLTLTLALAGSAFAGPVFLVSGRGWGHGVGMAQWGAYGLARQGWGYKQILAHYYQGTTLGTASAGPVRVLLTSGRKSVRIGSDAPFKVGSKELAAGAYEVARTDDGRVRIEGVEERFTGPVTFTATSAPLELGDAPYRGVLEVRTSGALSVVNQVGIDDYVAGVVPREVPSSWLPEVLKAQAVAARSYALSAPGHCEAGLFCPDVRDQVYGGVAAEQVSTSAAVSATAGEVLLHNGVVARTFFHSSSGGRTASVTDVWGGTLPYLVAVDDPFDVLSPHHRWAVEPLRARQLARRLGTGVPADATVTRNGSDRVQSVSLSTPAGTEAVSGASFQARLGLRSTWFAVDVLDVTLDAARSTCKTPVSLTVLARGVPDVALEHLPVTGGEWKRLRLRAAEDARFTARHRPCVSTRYRLVTPAFTGAATQVAVAPRINFTRRQRAGRLRGVVRPRLEGAPVRIQRQKDGRWRTVATATVTARGTFSAKFRVRPGVYRARIGRLAERGLVAGVSPTLTIARS